MTETDTNIPASVKLPGGNVGLRLASGELLDPAFVSLSNLVRTGDEQLVEILAWLEAERARRAERLGERLATVDVEAIQRDVEARHAAFKEYNERTLTRADL